MTKEDIIERLASVNKRLAYGDKSNPATILAGDVVIYSKEMTNEDKKELVKVIGVWAYKKGKKEKSDLDLQKTMLESELKTYLNC